jgi:hypothetical protein
VTVLDSLFQKVGDYLGMSKSQRTVPPGAEWSVVEDDDALRIGVTIEAELLNEVFEKDGASSPTFALCLAAWLTRMGEPARAEITVLNTSLRQTPDQRRAAFILHEYEQLLPGLFTVSGAPRWSWPPAPVFNVESRRSARVKLRGRHGQLAQSFAGDRDLREVLGQVDGPVEPLRSGMPVGLFSNEVSPDTLWTPAGASAVDLWTRTRDHRVVHLFELKAKGKASVGILPEALYYSRLLSYVRDRRSIEYAPTADGMSAVRNCHQLRMWLAAASLHPLVWHPECGSAPLDALNTQLTRDRLSLGVMPVTVDPPTLGVNERWPTGDATRSS